MDDLFQMDGTLEDTRHNSVDNITDVKLQYTLIDIRRFYRNLWLVIHLIWSESTLWNPPKMAVMAWVVTCRLMSLSLCQCAFTIDNTPRRQNKMEAPSVRRFCGTFPHNLAFCRVVLATSTSKLDQTYLYDDWRKKKKKKKEKKKPWKRLGFTWCW